MTRWRRFKVTAPYVAGGTFAGLNLTNLTIDAIFRDEPSWTSLLIAVVCVLILTFFYLLSCRQIEQRDVTINKVLRINEDLLKHNRIVVFQRDAARAAVWGLAKELHRLQNLPTPVKTEESSSD